CSKGGGRVEHPPRRGIGGRPQALCTSALGSTPRLPADALLAPSDRYGTGSTPVGLALEETGSRTSRPTLRMVQSRRQPVTPPALGDLIAPLVDRGSHQTDGLVQGNVLPETENAPT